MIRSPSKYAVESPRLTLNGELSACCDLASGSVYRVVIRMPLADAVLPTRLPLGSVVETRHFQKYKAFVQSNLAAVCNEDRFQWLPSVNERVVCSAQLGYWRNLHASRPTQHVCGHLCGSCAGIISCHSPVWHRRDVGRRTFMIEDETRSTS